LEVKRTKFLNINISNRTMIILFLLTLMTAQYSWIGLYDLFRGLYLAVVLALWGLAVGIVSHPFWYTSIIGPINYGFVAIGIVITLCVVFANKIKEAWHTNWLRTKLFGYVGTATTSTGSEPKRPLTAGEPKALADQTKEV